MLALHVTPADGDPFRRDLDGPEVVVGRSTTADVTVADRFLSRRHARLFRAHGGWLIEDLGSRNGTFVNGVRIDAPTAIAAGDVVSVSASTLRFLDGDAEPPLAGRQALGTASVFRPASDLVQSSAEPPVADTAAPESMRRYAEKLAILNDVHRTLATSITLEDLLDTILDRVFSHLHPERGAVFLKAPHGGLERAASRPVGAEDDDFVVSSNLAAEVVERGMAALVHDVRADHRFAEAQSLLDCGIRSLLAAPLTDPNGALGMIVLSSSARVRVFNEDDMELLSSLASVAALRIRNLELAEEAAEHRRLEREVTLAREIQTALIPDRLPSVDGYELYGGNLPSQGVSGDYYEVGERLDGHECVLLIADVSGKGIAASLLTAYIEALSTPAIESGLPPEEVFTHVSRRLFRRTPPERFATALLAVLEPASGRLRYANAGHNPALLLRATGAVEALGSTGMPLGLLPLAEYEGAAVELEHGDTLVLYTDGYTEAINPAEEEFGPERLESLCRNNAGLPLAELAAALNGELDRFAEGVPFADDRTLVMLRRSP